MTKNIVLLASLDTKAPEPAFLRDCITEAGHHCVVLDIGYGRSAGIESDIPAEEVAAAAGTDIDTIRAMQDTGAASNLVMQGAIIRVHALLRDGRCDGVLGFGGASNTTLASGVMQAIPVGIPKLLISSSAAMPAYAAKYYGAKDITIMNAIVDISGINTITKSLLRRGAGAICGMAESSRGEVRSLTGKKLVAVSGFRFAEECSQAVMRELERRDYSPIPFHAQGVGENAM
ncbi:MAG: Tm-1-like ATP-binding domain-containing protein, partial [Gammaproteobacteria bacterium]|nr:Tm-1-like ATP-binding domain-containing protein [Gammaproteobacteria bacterium]